MPASATTVTQPLAQDLGKPQRRLIVEPQELPVPVRRGDEPPPVPMPEPMEEPAEAP